MEIKETDLNGVYIITPKVFGDNRGFFMETYNKKVFKEAGIDIEWGIKDPILSEKDRSHPNLSEISPKELF